MSVFRRGGKDKDKDKKPRHNFTSAAAIVTSPSGKGGFQPLTSLNPPEFIPGEPESSPCSHHSTSVSDASRSALTRKSGRLLESEREMELEEVTDGATGGASGGDKEKEKKKWLPKMHRPPGTKKLFPKEKYIKRPSSTSSGSDSQHVPEDALWVESVSDWPPETIVEEQQAEIDRLQAELRRVVEEKQTLEADVREREGQQAEVERLQTEVQTLVDEKERLERRKNGEIKEVEGRCRALINGKVGEIRRKDDEIKRLQREIANLNTIKESDEATRQKLRDVMQKEKTTQRELARVTEDLQAASQREKDLQHAMSHLQGLHQEAIEGLNRDYQTKLQWQEEELTRQITDKVTADSEVKIRDLEGERDRLNQQLTEVCQERDSMRGELEKVRDLKGERDQQLESLEQERDRVKEELAKKCLDIQAVQLEKDEVESALQDAEERLAKADKESEILKQQMEQQATALQERDHLTAELETKVQQLEQEVKEKEDTIVALLDEQQPPPPQLAPPPADQSAGDALKKLETKCCLLENENQKLRAQVANPVPSNVHHFCLQLSKLVDPQGESAETAFRTVVVQDVIPLLQAMGRGVEYKPKGYVIALFHAFNQSQSILLDYTQIGEVVQFKGPGEHLDTSDAGEEVEKSPYSSLEGVKLAVTDGNMTDADKLELERMLRESQEKLDKLQVENKNLLELLQLQNQTPESKEEVPNLHPADVPQQQAGSRALKDLKAKYLLLFDEKLQLLEKLEQRDTQLQQLHEETLPERDGRPPVSHPDVERSLSTGDLSPDDPKAEVKKLRKVIEEKDMKIDNLNVQLRSFEVVASGNMSLGEEIAKLKDKLEAAQAEIKALRDQSELVQVYNFLRIQLARTREDLCKSENRAADAETEKEILENEISTERDNNQNLQSELARLTLALHFYETKYPQDDAEGLCGLEDGAMKPEKDGEVVEQLKAEITDLQAMISQKEAAVMNLTKSRRIVESRLQRVQEERDKLAEQILSLIAVRDNLKRELKDTVQVKEQLQDSVVAMETEAEGWKREKEEMIKEIQALQDYLGARKEEVDILRKDFEQRLVVDGSNKAKKWRAQEQIYREQLQNFDRQLRQLIRDSEQKVKQLTHEADQRVVKLTIKLDQKVDELKSVTDNAVKCQREFDAICDQLRQERDNVLTERDRYKDERDTWCAEYNTFFTTYDEKKKKHQAEVDKINEEMDLWKVKCATFDDNMREMEAEAHKKEKEREIAASKNHQLSNQLQEMAHQLNTEKQEKGQLSAKLAALNHQYRLEHETWLTDKSNMDRAISNMTQQVQELQRISEILRGRLQTEQMNVQQLERELQSSQELLQSHSKRAEEKVEEWKGRATNAIDRQREFETFYEQLRLELDRVQMDRDHFEEERDSWSAEYNRAMTMHEEMKHQNITIQGEKLEIQGRLADLNHQWQLDLAAWQQDKKRLEHEATRLSEELMHLRQQLRQADVAKYHPLGDELRPYEMTDVDPVQGSLFKDNGSNGYVSLVRVCGGVKCIEKRIHDILIGRGRNEDVDQAQRGRINEKFRKECVILSQMRHPNVVQFVGVQYHRDNSLSLIMEYLPMSMDKCLARCNSENFSIPLCFKLSILRDVAYGLLHLHVHQIVHRDLSAGNILLTSDLRAKIADLGMSRHLNPATMSKLTTAPGALYIMPPEALMEGDCQYTNKIDIFSFGVLVLQLMLQKCPKTSQSRLTDQHWKDKELEIGKRIQSIEEVSRLCKGEVKSIVCACLQDVPDKRPPALRLKDRFEHLCQVYPNERGDTIAMLQAINKLEANKLQVP